jgi:hypothetical protein
VSPWRHLSSFICGRYKCFFQRGVCSFICGKYKGLFVERLNSSIGG